MKKAASVILFLILITDHMKGQESNQISLNLSLSQIELCFHYITPVQNMKAETYIGIGNQDINRQFDDFLTGLRLQYKLYTYKRNTLSVYSSVGIYASNNDYYKPLTPVFGFGNKYISYIGKSEKFFLTFNLGMQYGRSKFRQGYASEIIKTSTISEFRLNPLSFSFGLGLNLHKN